MSRHLRDILCKNVTFSLLYWGGRYWQREPDFLNHFQTFLDQTFAHGDYFTRGKVIFVIFGFFATFVAKKQQMTKTSAYFSVFFEFFKIFQQMLINFFMALKYGIRAFERTWTRTKIFKTRFSMLC